MTLGLAFDRGAVRARASVPYYHLHDLDGLRNGFGDLDARVELALYRGEHGSFGPGASVSLPTGSAWKDLGMGHVMAGASIWGAWQASRWFVGSELGYARALGDTAHHEHAHAHHVPGGQAPSAASAMVGPIPNPMSTEEVWASVSVSYEAMPTLRPSVAALGAVPLSVEAGSARATLVPSVEFPLGRVTTAVGVEADFVGATRRKLVFFRVGLGF